MEYEEVKALREAWGDKDCDHPGFTDEILFGSKTGDFVCIQCGKSFTKRERDSMNRAGVHPKLTQLTEQNRILKERIDIINTRKSKFESMAAEVGGHTLLDSLLLQQQGVIALLDEMIESTESS
ncbi:hypothetical protein Q8A57_10985 [Porticoccus litoralis]|jgi:uncharacterized Zn finger protein (UPF0148 family)|uniref:C2H2-type domain-containing protein n=1 Tax=Porticoccus litoralis TaxID=434086 RepID=A0AAW8B9N7_9GAMM|nr:hypothetical protein [Porticoccus litoralis]MDP1521494.1 hypothetical protein [Porticoccus litoralis]